MAIEFFKKSSFNIHGSNDCPRISINFDSGTFNINRAAFKILSNHTGSVNLVFGFDQENKTAFVKPESIDDAFFAKSIHGEKSTFKCSFRSKPLSELFSKLFPGDVFKNRLQIVVDDINPETGLFQLLTLPASTIKLNKN